MKSKFRLSQIARALDISPETVANIYNLKATNPDPLLQLGPLLEWCKVSDRNHMMKIIKAIREDRPLIDSSVILQLIPDMKRTDFWNYIAHWKHLEPVIRRSRNMTRFYAPDAVARIGDMLKFVETRRRNLPLPPAQRTFREKQRLERQKLAQELKEQINESTHSI